jgi:hypothetical protein
MKIDFIVHVKLLHDGFGQFHIEAIGLAVVVGELVRRESAVALNLNNSAGNGRYGIICGKSPEARCADKE